MLPVPVELLDEVGDEVHVKKPRRLLGRFRS